MLTADFVAAVRRQASLTAQSADADILAWGDQEVRGHFMPLLRAMRAEYGVRRLLLPIANGRAQIPDRAQVSGVRLVQLVQGNSYVTLPQVQPEDDYGPGAGGVPYGWYFDAGTICVVPSSASGTLLVRYYQQASSMILSSTVATASEISTVVETATTVTLTFNGGTTLAGGDVIAATPDHRVVTPSLVGGTGTAAWSKSIYALIDYDVPVEALDPSRTITAGDWVAPNGRTPFVPLPEELSAALVHRTAGTILRALGYLNESAAALELAGEAEAKVRVLLAPRSEGNPRSLLGGLSSATGRRPWRW